MKLLIATRNPKKLVELDRILHTADINSVELLSFSDVLEYSEHPETGRTFADNAYIRAFDGATHTGYACLADDSGLDVDELNGIPGMLSARWSSTHGDDVTNYELLLAQMGDYPDERRAASFCTTCALVVSGVKEVPFTFVDSGFPAVLNEAGNLLLVVKGRWSGSVLHEPVGNNGFGYDPVFTPAADEGNETGGALPAAQMSAEGKDTFSHRGHALRALTPALKILAEVGTKG